MDRNKIVKFLMSSVKDIREQSDAAEACLSEDTVLFGREGVLTSLLR